MSYFESTQDLIGNTPLVKLTHLGLPEGTSLFAKLELYNPGGSVKDRIGRSSCAGPMSRPAHMYLTIMHSSMYLITSAVRLSVARSSWKHCC